MYKILGPKFILLRSFQNQMTKRTNTQLYKLHNGIQIDTCDNTMNRILGRNLPFRIPSKMVLRNRNTRFHPIYHNQNKLLHHKIRNNRMFYMNRKIFVRILSTIRTPGIPRRKRSCMRHMYMPHYQRNSNNNDNMIVIVVIIRTKKVEVKYNTRTVLALLPSSIISFLLLFLTYDLRRHNQCRYVPRMHPHHIRVVAYTYYYTLHHMVHNNTL